MGHKKEPQLFLVTWLDACSLDGGGWNTHEDVRALRGIPVCSVGWLVKEREHMITLVGSYHANGYSGDVCIPKGCIISKTLLAPAGVSP